MKKLSSIFLVDDHPVILAGITKMIEYTKDLEVCGYAEDFASALENIRKHLPDLVVVDLFLKGEYGIELIKQLKKHHQHLPILVLTMHEDHIHAKRALQAGAIGYATKQEAPEKIINAIRLALQGKRYISEKIATAMIERLIRPENTEQPEEQLSDREIEVLQLMGQRFATREIATHLHLSVKTIETYQMRIKQKLHLKNALELIHYACRYSKLD